MLRDATQAIKAFHEATGLPVAAYFNEELLKLRRSLLTEEYIESCQEFIAAADALATGGQPSATVKANLTKELADLIYVILGAAVAFGLPISEVFERIHAANLTKIGPNGEVYRNEAGKVLKGPHYRPADVSDLF